jgi:hypothetical protein
MRARACLCKVGGSSRLKRSHPSTHARVCRHRGLGAASQIGHPPRVHGSAVRERPGIGTTDPSTHACTGLPFDPARLALGQDHPPTRARVCQRGPRDDWPTKTIHPRAHGSAVGVPLMTEAIPPSTHARTGLPRSGRRRDVTRFHPPTRARVCLLEIIQENARSMAGCVYVPVYFGKTVRSWC